MVNCNNCDKYFKTNWHLQRHINKKIHCIKKKPKDPEKKPKDPEKKPKDPIEKSKNPNNCNWCKKLFTTKNILQKHLKTCKMKNDEIRNLEIQTNTEFTLHSSDAP